MSVGDAFGPTTCGRVEYNAHQANANIIVIREPWHGDSSALALTTLSYGVTTGEIYDADIEINGLLPITAGPLGPNFFDLQSILTHETGHFLGLTHSNEPGATMGPRYSPGADNFRTLEGDDVDGICAVYPPERNAPCDPSPRRGFSPECGLDPITGGGCSLASTRSRSSARGMSGVVIALGMAVGRRRRSWHRAQNVT
jgi:hypothetical protein